MAQLAYSYSDSFIQHYTTCIHTQRAKDHMLPLLLQHFSLGSIPVLTVIILSERNILLQVT